MDFVTWVRAQWDRVAGFSLIGAGAIAVLIGFRGVSHSPFLADQLAYIASGGIGGLLLVGIGATLLISADLQDEWRKLDRIEAALLGHRGSETGVASASPAVGPALPGSTGEVTLDSPQARHTLAVAAIALLVAAAVVVAGWDTAAHDATLNGALDGVRLAAAGVAIFALGAIVSTILLKGQIRRRQDALFEPVVIRMLAKELEFEQADQTAGEAENTALVAEGLSRYHRPGCPAVAHIAAVSALDPNKVPRKLSPCGLCSPTPMS